MFPTSTAQKTFRTDDRNSFSHSKRVISTKFGVKTGPKQVSGTQNRLLEDEFGLPREVRKAGWSH